MSFIKLAVGRKAVAEKFPILPGLSVVSVEWTGKGVHT